MNCKLLTTTTPAVLGPQRACNNYFPGLAFRVIIVMYLNSTQDIIALFCIIIINMHLPTYSLVFFFLYLLSSFICLFLSWIMLLLSAEFSFNIYFDLGFLVVKSVSCRWFGNFVSHHCWPCFTTIPWSRIFKWNSTWHFCSHVLALLDTPEITAPIEVLASVAANTCPLPGFSVSFPEAIAGKHWKGKPNILNLGSAQWDFSLEIFVPHVQTALTDIKC